MPSNIRNLVQNRGDQQILAAKLGVSDRTVRRYVHRPECIPKHMKILIAKIAQELSDQPPPEGDPA